MVAVFSIARKPARKTLPMRPKCYPVCADRHRWLRDHNNAMSHILRIMCSATAVGLAVLLAASIWRERPRSGSAPMRSRARLGAAFEKAQRTQTRLHVGCGLYEIEKGASFDLAGPSETLSCRRGSPRRNQRLSRFRLSAERPRPRSGEFMPAGLFECGREFFHRALERVGAHDLDLGRAGRNAGGEKRHQSDCGGGQHMTLRMSIWRFMAIPPCCIRVPGPRWIAAAACNIARVEDSIWGASAKSSDRAFERY